MIVWLNYTRSTTQRSNICLWAPAANQTHQGHGFLRLLLLELGHLTKLNIRLQHFPPLVHTLLPWISVQTNIQLFAEISEKAAVGLEKQRIWP